MENAYHVYEKRSGIFKATIGIPTSEVKALKIALERLEQMVDDADFHVPAFPVCLDVYKGDSGERMYQLFFEPKEGDLQRLKGLLEGISSPDEGYI